MSISALNNPNTSKELLDALRTRENIKRKMRKQIKASNADFRMGADGYINGFNLEEYHAPKSYFSLEYYNGWKAAQAIWPDWQKREDAPNEE